MILITKLSQKIPQYINPGKFRKAVAALNRSDILLPIVLLEGSVIAGRTYNSHKRSGFIESRERFTEELITSIFWLWGINMFNKLGDKIGEKIFRLKDAAVAYGADTLRHPLKNIANNNINLEKKLAAFKFGKTLASVALAITFAGVIVPKFNQAITAKLFAKQKKQQKDKLKFKNIDARNFPWIKDYSAQYFKARKPNFKGLSGVPVIEQAGYLIEQNAICKLLSIDVGVFAGRAYYSRNAHDRNEKLIRDGASSYFYVGAAPHIRMLFRALDKYKNIQKLNPVTAAYLHNQAVFYLKRAKLTTVTPDKFAEIMLGNRTATISRELLSKAKDGRILLSDFITAYPDKAKIAKGISELQPKFLGESILSVKQANSALSGGAVNSPYFLKRVFNSFFGKKEMENIAYYVPQKKIEGLQTEIVKFVEDTVKLAKAQKQDITIDFLKKVNKRNLIRSSITTFTGLGVAMLFLSTIIPKFQNWVTKIRTGKDSFPGIEEYKK